MIRGLGWKRDRLDHRDHKFSAKPLPAGIPASVDLRAGLPAPYDQGQLGSCTGNGIAAILQYHRRKQGLDDFTPSRLYIYYREREIEGTIDQDAGAEIRDGLKVVSHYGAPDEALWPYNVDQYAVEPSAAAEAGAARDIAIAYQRIDNTDLGALKGCLAGGLPIVFGCSVYQQFEDTNASGAVIMPTSSEAPIGGHCMVAVGYDDSTSQFAVRNSWGTGWGFGGYCWMPYAYLTNPGLTSDCWTVSLIGDIS